MRVSDPRTRARELPAASCRSRTPFPSCRVLDAEGGWYAIVQVPSLTTEEDLVVALLTTEGVLVHPGLLLRLSSRVVSRRQPAAAEARVRRGRRGGAAALRLHGRTMSIDAPPAGGSADSACSPVRRPSSWGIGDIARRRRRVGVAGVGWPAGAATAAAQRDGAGPSSLRTRRSRRWPSIRSTSACRGARLPGARRRRLRSRRGSGAISRRCVRAPRDRLRAVRALKTRALDAAFERFVDAEWQRDSDRARATCGATRRIRRGGSTTTRSSGRFALARTSGRGRNGPSPLKARVPDALARRPSASWLDRHAASAVSAVAG